MAIDAWYDLGPVAGDCRLCDTPGRLFLGEFRTRVGLSGRLRGLRPETTSRMVSCRSCAWRWTVRKDDTWLPAVATFQGRGSGVAQPAQAGSADRRGTARPTLSERVPLSRGRHGRPPIPWPRSCERREHSEVG